MITPSVGEQQYLDTLDYIRRMGKRKNNRTGVDTLGILGVQHRYDLTNFKIPLFTTKKVWFKGVAVELLWFLRGSKNVKYLVDRGVNIWNDDAYKFYKNNIIKKNKSKTIWISLRGFLARHLPVWIWPFGRVKKLEAMNQDEWLNEIKNASLDPSIGYMGPIYGRQWREFNGHVDQINALLRGLQSNPDSRRHILTSWNPEDVNEVALPPCHVLAQFSVVDGELTCHMYQRSCDMFLGVPFNVASYSLLTHILAVYAGLRAKEFIHTMHDCHIYENHLDAVDEQLTRTPKESPILHIHTKDEISLNDFIKHEWDDIFEVKGYNPDPPIKAKLVT